jgi:hypothetical protein
VSVAAITLCVASQRVFIVVSVYFFMTQSGNFLIHPLRYHTGDEKCIQNAANLSADDQST